MQRNTPLPRVILPFPAPTDEDKLLAEVEVDVPACASPQTVRMRIYRGGDVRAHVMPLTRPSASPSA